MCQYSIDDHVFTGVYIPRGGLPSHRAGRAAAEIPQQPRLKLSEMRRRRSRRAIAGLIARLVALSLPGLQRASKGFPMGP